MYLLEKANKSNQIIINKSDDSKMEKQNIARQYSSFE